MDIEKNNDFYEISCNLADKLKFEKRYVNDRNTLETNGYVSSFLDIDPALPPTPVETGYIEGKKIPVSSKSLCSYAISLSLYPVVYQGENDGKIIRHVVPKKGAVKQTSSHGSRKIFYPHVDNPDLRLRGESKTISQSPCPDTLTLLCLRNHEGVSTSLLKLDDVLADLSSSDVNLLYDPFFIATRPDSFEAHDVSNSQVPLLSKDDNGYICSRFDYHNVSSVKNKYANVLEKLRKSARDEEKWISILLEPGLAVTFDNQRMLHTRNGFIPKGNGEDRWLLRMFGLFSPPPVEALLEYECKHHIRTIF